MSEQRDRIKDSVCVHDRKTVSTADLPLSHFSYEPVRSVYSVEQKWRLGIPCVFEKPKGFWVSVDGERDWLSYCEMVGADVGPVRHRVVLSTDTKILRCRDRNDLVRFTERYGFEIELGFIAINWHQLATEYQGLIIAPSVPTFGLDQPCNWYYGWDCASGCIWDGAAIASVEVVER